MASKINVDKIARNSGTPEFTVPTADGAANTVLQTDGSGVLSFTPNVINSSNVTYTGNSVLDIKNSGTASSIKLYCESSNAHYTEIKSGPHSGATQYTLTLPNTPPTVSGQFLSATTAGAASWTTVASSGFNSVQVFTSSDTWSRPTGVTKVIMEVQGGGGAGGGGGPGKGDGGGGGGYSKKFLDVASIASSTITVGAGGVNASTNSPGPAGTASSWADGTNTITGNGGAGGAATNGGGGIGGTAVGGNLNIQGGSGGGGTNENNVGGGSPFSPQHYAYNANSNPTDPTTGYGGGGEGSRLTGGGPGSKGANGANGIVIVWEYK